MTDIGKIVFAPPNTIQVSSTTKPFKDFEYVPAVYHQNKLKRNPMCLWKYDNTDDAWSGDCEIMFCLQEGTLPAANDMIYCPKCGRQIKVDSYE